MESTVILLRQPGIQKYGLGMSDMKIPVGLRREPGTYLRINALCKILIYFLLDKISGNHFFSHIT